jgi:hypothetical protein
MNLELFKEMDRESLLTYLEFLLTEHRVVDAFWFLTVEENYGRPVAEKINEEVWARIVPMSIRDLKSFFRIEGGGLEAMERALRLFPWTTIGDHQIRRTDRELVLTAPRCPPQIARVKRGLGEYACKEMHQRVFANTAKEIDPCIRVTCDFAPPDAHPEDLFCRWRFSISEEGAS